MNFDHGKPIKHCLGPQNGPGSTKICTNIKTSKNKLVGIGGQPPIITWMLCMDPGQLGKCRTHNYKEISPLKRNMLN
jgi:hypothetical protein